MYLRLKEDEQVYLLVYVDDILLIGPSAHILREVASDISKMFDIRIEATITKFLGISCDIHENEVIIHGAAAVNRVLHQFNMESCRTATTPLPAVTVLDKSFEPKTSEERIVMQSVPYQELVGSLLYLANTTRPDISYVVGLLSRYVKNPGKAHWKAGLHVLRYLSGTRDGGIRFRSHGCEGMGSFMGYADADLRVIAMRGNTLLDACLF